MAIEQAKEFENQIKMLFFQSNKMDVWQRIAARAQQMEADAAHAARRKKEAAKKKQQELDELFIILIGGLVVVVTIGATIWFIMEATAQGAG
jgi:type VI protein secretion system component VasF